MFEACKYCVLYDWTNLQSFIFTQNCISIFRLISFPNILVKTIPVCRDMVASRYSIKNVVLLAHPVIVAISGHLHRKILVENNALGEYDKQLQCVRRAC